MTNIGIGSPVSERIREEERLCDFNFGTWNV